MIVLGDKKYACESCIKGHRSSTCKHTERPLFEVKKKGRPSTQCEHCRELRRTKQVHVKCKCEGSTTPIVPIPEEGGSGVDLPAKLKVRKVKKPLDGAAFPTGLPAEALEASLALQLLSGGSESGCAVSPKACGCNIGEPCHCVDSKNRAPRKPKAKSPPIETTQPSTTSSSSSSGAPTPATVNLAKHHFRPVLPRPAHPSNGPVHDPSTSTNPHPHARHTSLYSPYGRAYEHLGGEAPVHPGLRLDPQMAAPPPASGAPPTHIAHEQPFAPPQTPTGAVGPVSWPVTMTTLPSGEPLSEVACGCGPSCACPGCPEHAGAGALDAAGAQAWAMCADPMTCTACLQCAIMSMPPQGVGAQGRDGSLGDAGMTETAEDYGAIDEWIRQVEAHAQQPFDMGQAMQGLQQGSQVSNNTRHAQGRPFDPEATPLPQQQWLYPQDYQPEDYSLPPDTSLGSGPFSASSPCCVGPCRCPPGECACLPKQCACELGAEDTASGPLGITFSSSSERSPCCDGRIDPALSSARQGGHQSQPFPRTYESSYVNTLSFPAFPEGLTGYGRIDEHNDGYYIVTSSDGSSSPRSTGFSSRRSSYSAPRPFAGGLSPMSALPGRPRSGSAVSTGQASSVAASINGYDFGDMQP